jgi:selenide,water dikinase
VHPQRIFAKGGAQPGDALVLTKALGTGIVLTAARAGEDPAGHAAAAERSMLTLNRHASHVAREAGAHAMTDVTGFSLLGHASEMAERSGVRMVIKAPQVPMLPGALEYASAGIITGGARRNREGLAGRLQVDPAIDGALEHVLYDPQTSGGLLVALPRAAAEAMVDQLRVDGLPAAIIGRIEAGSGVSVT